MNPNTMSIIAELAKRMRIMIVDSDSENLTRYKDFLASFFVEVNCIQQSKDGFIKWIEDPERYDIILLAINKSNIANTELFKRIRKKSYEQKILIALESNDYNDLEDIISEGIDGIIKGPSDTTGLLKILYRLLRDISDRKLLHSYITQLSMMTKDYADLHLQVQKQNEQSEAVLPTETTEQSSNISANSLIDKYKIRTSFKDEKTANAIRQMDIFSMEKIDVFREKIDVYHQQLIDADQADAVTSRSIILQTSNGLLKIIEVINTLDLFPVTVQAGLHMITFLQNLDLEVFEDSEKKHLILDILIALFDDLEKWIDTVFIQQDFQHVNYFDASFANTCLELESAFSEQPINEEDDALEFF